MQTGSIGADERAFRAGTAVHSDSFCCADDTRIEMRWRCRLPASRAGWRQRGGFVTRLAWRRHPQAGAADRAARGPQHAAIVLFERRRTMRERLFALIQFR
ncbi:hypothetical protein [Burkholderia anthina]|uniref:hypothetical protein n=1 Tax=Burkholderia anthina TaxID=179879 RepID=UPI003342DA9A